MSVSLLALCHFLLILRKQFKWHYDESFGVMWVQTFWVQGLDKALVSEKKLHSAVWISYNFESVDASSSVKMR